jgi:hypothetical protein
MPRSSAAGLSEGYSLLDSLAPAAQDELVVELGIIGADLLGAQRADVPEATGALGAALSLQLIAQRLKLRVGLLIGGRGSYSFNGRQRKAAAGGPFYGRFVEYGRKAQTVLVTRRVKKRRVKGNGRNGTKRRVTYVFDGTRLRRRGPNRGTPIGSPYRLKVKAKDARHFVEQPLLEQIAEQDLSDFWTNVLARYA